MFKTLQATFPADKDLPTRAFRLEMLQRVLDGKLYDNLPHDFHEEKAPNGEYVELRKRRPSVRYRLCGLVVDDSVSLLFSEAHFPAIESKTPETREQLEKLVKETKLNERMIHAATRGSVGSVVLFLRVLKDRPFIDVLETTFLTPVWRKDAPDTLAKVVERYKAKGSELVEAGYEVADEDLSATFWFRREWDDAAENWFVPQKIVPGEKLAAPAIDTGRTVKHGLGFVPMIWVKNLPGGDDVDGNPTFPDEAIDTSIEIDYLLSQGSRGLKYSSDPTLLIKEPAFAEQGAVVRSASNALVVSADGDAKLLEINGTAAAAIVEYARAMRELALESMHGNRANADKLSAAQSGRAMELMNQALIWLADRLRISYGEGALLELLGMIVLASEKRSLKFKDGTDVGKLAGDGLALRWPRWYQPTASDQQETASTLSTLVDSSIISLETATKVVAADYDVEDVGAERAQADKELAARNAEAQKQVKITE